MQTFLTITILSAIAVFVLPEWFFSRSEYSFYMSKPLRQRITTVIAIGLLCGAAVVAGIWVYDLITPWMGFLQV